MTPRLLRAPATDGGLLVDPPPGSVPANPGRQPLAPRNLEPRLPGPNRRPLREQVRREVLALAAELSQAAWPGRAAGLSVMPPSGRSARWSSPGISPSCSTPASGSRTSPPPAIAAEHHGGRAQPDRRQRPSQVGVDPGAADRRRHPPHEPGRFRSLGRARSRSRTCASRTKISSRPSPVGYASGLGQCRRPDRCSTTSGPGARAAAETASPGLRFSLARRELEASWGVSNLEVPAQHRLRDRRLLWFVLPSAGAAAQSICRFITTRWRNTAWPTGFAAGTTLSRHSRCRASGSKPRSGSGAAGIPRRRGLLARLRGREIDLRIAGEDRDPGELPLGPDREACCAVERLRDLAGPVRSARTRALTTTLFSRFLLSDLFIHGIGGSKYDELGDEIARRFFGIEPPAFLTVSLTSGLGLPLDSTAPDPADFDALRGSHNPDRHLHEPFPDELRILSGTSKS